MNYNDVITLVYIKEEYVKGVLTIDELLVENVKANLGEPTQRKYYELSEKNIQLFYWIKVREHYQKDRDGYQLRYVEIPNKIHGNGELVRYQLWKDKSTRGRYVNWYAREME